MNFCKILLKFAIFKFFQYFLSFSEFNDHYWPKNFSSLGDGLLDRTFETKNGLVAEFKTFNFAFFSFLYDLFVNKIRKLKVDFWFRTSAAVLWRYVAISDPHYQWVIVELFFIINDLTGTFRKPLLIALKSNL